MHRKNLKGSKPLKISAWNSFYNANGPLLILSRLLVGRWQSTRSLKISNSTLSVPDLHTNVAVQLNNIIRRKWLSSTSNLNDYLYLTGYNENPDKGLPARSGLFIDRLLINYNYSAGRRRYIIILHQVRQVINSVGMGGLTIRPLWALFNMSGVPGIPRSRSRWIQRAWGTKLAPIAKSNMHLRALDIKAPGRHAWSFVDLPTWPQ